MPDLAQEPPFIHSRARVETEHIGPGRRSWAFAHVSPGEVGDDVFIGPQVTFINDHGGRVQSQRG